MQAPGKETVQRKTHTMDDQSRLPENLKVSCIKFQSLTTFYLQTSIYWRKVLATRDPLALLCGGNRIGGISVIHSCLLYKEQTEALLRTAIALCPFLSQLSTDFDGTETDNRTTLNNNWCYLLAFRELVLLLTLVNCTFNDNI